MWLYFNTPKPESLSYISNIKQKEEIKIVLLSRLNNLGYISLAMRNNIKSDLIYET